MDGTSSGWLNWSARMLFFLGMYLADRYQVQFRPGYNLLSQTPHHPGNCASLLFRVSHNIGLSLMQWGVLEDLYPNQSSCNQFKGEVRERAPGGAFPSLLQTAPGLWHEFQISSIYSLLLKPPTDTLIALWQRNQLHRIVQSCWQYISCH